MKRQVLVLAVLLAAAVVSGLTVAYLTEPGSQRGPAVERTCGAEEIGSGVAHLKVDGTTIELYCGDRLVVTDGKCEIQRGAEFSPARCTEGGE